MKKINKKEGSYMKEQAKLTAKIFGEGITQQGEDSFNPTVMVIKQIDASKKAIYLGDMINQSHYYVEMDTSSVIALLEESFDENMLPQFNYIACRGKIMVIKDKEIQAASNLYAMVSKSKQINDFISCIEFKRFIEGLMMLFFPLPSDCKMH